MKFWRVVSTSSTMMTMIIRLRFRLTRVSHEQQSLDCWRRGRKRWLAIYVAPMAEDFTSTSSATFRPPKMCGAKIIRKPKMKDKFFFSHLIRFRNYFLLNEKCFWRQQHWQRERNREKTLQTILMSKKSLFIFENNYFIFSQFLHHSVAEVIAGVTVAFDAYAVLVTLPQRTVETSQVTGRRFPEPLCRPPDSNGPVVWRRDEDARVNRVPAINVINLFLPQPTEQQIGARFWCWSSSW